MRSGASGLGDGFRHPKSPGAPVCAVLGRHNAGREDYLRDAAVKWPYLKQEMWWLFGSGTERSGISTGRQGEA